MFKLITISSTILGALLIGSPMNGLIANAPITPSGYIEKSTTKTEAGEINFHLFECIDANSHVNQNIVAIYEDTDTIVLENGSKWHVSKIDAVKGWDMSDQLIITHNHAFFSSHRFALVNVKLGLAVPFSLVISPTPDSSNVLYIKSIDSVQNIVHLNNDEQYIVNSKDLCTLSKFRENGQVLVGVNTLDKDGDYPYLILDASLNTTSYIRASLVNQLL